MFPHVLQIWAGEFPQCESTSTAQPGHGASSRLVDPSRLKRTHCSRLPKGLLLFCSHFTLGILFVVFWGTHSLSCSEHSSRLYGTGQRMAPNSCYNRRNCICEANKDSGRAFTVFGAGFNCMLLLETGTKVERTCLNITDSDDNGRHLLCRSSHLICPC